MTPNLLALAHKTLGHLATLLTTAGLFTAVDFTHTITLGSIVLAFVILIISGIFTVRSKIATIWRQEAEGERAAKERLEEVLTQERAERAAFDRAQQELRHDLKDELAQCKAQLKVMEAKTDLSTALDAIREMNESSVKSITQVVADVFVEKSKVEHAETHRLLGEIRDKLPSEPIEISVHEVQNLEE